MSLSIVLAVLACLGAGICVAFQSPTNSLLARTIDTPAVAALISFSVGAIVMLVAALPTLVRTPVTGLRGVPWWGFLGGVYGALVVSAIIFAVPRLGVASTLTLTIASQLAAAIVIDHFGLFGAPVLPINLTKAAGVTLVVLGALLVRR